MRICKIQGCNKKYSALEYCQNHYYHFKRYSNPLKYSDCYILKNCKIKNCGKKHYAKGYCRKHYAYHIGVSPKYGHRHNCKIKNCQNGTTRGYCTPHRYRIKRNFPLDLSINLRFIRMKGKNNPNWKGGIAEYPNHCLMKKNRLIILINNPKCEKCGKPAVEVHHRDGNKKNHKLSNLMASCCRCNSAIRFEPNNSKYRRLYGVNLQEIVDKIGRSIGYWSSHQKELDTILLDKILF